MCNERRPWRIRYRLPNGRVRSSWYKTEEARDRTVELWKTERPDWEILKVFAVGADYTDAWEEPPSGYP